MYLGMAMYPPALLISSVMQQSIPHLTVSRIKELNGVVRDLQRRQRMLTYNAPGKGLDEARIVIFSDAGYPHVTIPKLKTVAQEGCIGGISFGEKRGSTFHTLVYFSRKQRRKSDSSFAAECIAAVSAFGMGTMLQQVLDELLGVKLKITLVVDNSGLQKCISTESTPRDLSTMVDVSRLRMAYNEGFLDKVVWIRGVDNPSDALTKTLPGDTAGLLDELMNEGKLTVSVDNEMNRGKALTEEQ